MFPEETKKPNRGLPKRLKSSTLRQSGCAITQTLYPWASSVRVIIADPNDG